MHRFCFRLLFSLIALYALQTVSFASTSEINLLDWPKKIQSNSDVVTLYQPQVESLQKNQMTFQMAIAVNPSGSKHPQYGSVKAQCRLDTDTSKNIALCDHLHILRFAFPYANASEKSSLQHLEKHLQNQSFQMSLSNLTANVQMSEQMHNKRDAVFKFTPPKIYVATKPTALISIDGKPQLRPLGHSSLMHVINTPFVILLDAKSGTYYIQAGTEWMQSASVEGPWKVSTALPNAVKSVVRKQPISHSQANGAPVQNLIVSTQPSTLIQLNGKPEFTPIENTSLLYVSNTKEDVFMQVKTQDYYTLVSGRWYQSKSLNDSSAWRYVAAKDLPANFAQIPSNSVKASVLSSVPDTTAAKAALIRNQIPQTAVVRRDQATFSVRYDGTPDFVKIPSTKVYYARNANQAVFRVGNAYYGNEKGVWFDAKKATGPYVVATKVPDAIYEIPASSPHYNVTYSYVYGFTPEVVYVGYTPGYMGSYVYGGTVIYGTGYVYPGWVGTMYYGYPVTFGFGFYYAPYGGWYPAAPYAGPLWFGAGMAVGYAIGSHHYYGGWFGPNRYTYHGGHNNININVNKHTNIYNTWNKKTVVHNNGHNDLFEKNTINNTRVTPKQAKNARQQKSVGDGADQIQSARHAHNNVFAGKDGSVYRNHQGSWQKHTADGWTHHPGDHAFLGQQQEARQHTFSDARRHEDYRQRFVGGEGRGFGRRGGRGRF